MAARRRRTWRCCLCVQRLHQSDSNRTMDDAGAAGVAVASAVRAHRRAAVTAPTATAAGSSWLTRPATSHLRDRPSRSPWGPRLLRRPPLQPRLQLSPPLQPPLRRLLQLPRPPLQQLLLQRQAGCATTSRMAPPKGGVRRGVASLLPTQRRGLTAALTLWASPRPAVTPQSMLQTQPECNRDICHLSRLLAD